MMQDPVCTPEGVLYSREAILQSLLQQKKANKRKFAAWQSEQEDELQKVHLNPLYFILLHVLRLNYNILMSSKCLNPRNYHLGTSLCLGSKSCPGGGEISCG